MSNPMDLLEVARDLIRKEELERTFKDLHDLHKAWSDLDWHEMGLRNEEERGGMLSGLDEAMNYVDERIGYLRDRWTDSGVLFERVE